MKLQDDIVKKLERLSKACIYGKGNIPPGLKSDELEAVIEYVAEGLKDCDGTFESLHSLMKPTLARAFQTLAYVPPSRLIEGDLVDASPLVNGATPPIIGITRAYYGMPYRAWNLQVMHRLFFPRGTWKELHKLVWSGPSLDEGALKRVFYSDPVEQPMKEYIRTGCQEALQCIDEDAGLSFSSIADLITVTEESSDKLQKAIYHMITQRHVFHTSCQYVPNDPFDWDHRLTGFPVEFTEMEEAIYSSLL